MMELPYYSSATGRFCYDQDRTDSSAAESLYGYDDFDANECLRTFNSMVQRKQRSSLCQQDAAEMAAMYLVRGTSILALPPTTGDTSAASISRLISVYELRYCRQPKGVLTLARVCMTFAVTTVSVAIAMKDRLPVPHSRMTAMVPDYPAAMMTTAFCGLIPQEEPYTETIRDAHYLYVATLMKSVDFLLRAKSNREVLNSFEGLSLAVERNHPLTQAQRFSFLEMWGILVGGVCSEAVTNAAELFQKEYRRPTPGLYGNPDSQRLPLKPPTSSPSGIFRQIIELPYYLSSTGGFCYDRDKTDSSAAESLYGYDDFDANECLRTFNSMVQRSQRSSVCQQDAAEMAVMYLVRGTSILALRTTCGDKIAASIHVLMNIYELGLSRQPKGVLTLARVCMTLAVTTVSVAITMKDRLPVPHSRMTAMVSDYPAAMMTTAFCGLIPQGEAYTETIRDAHYLYVATLMKSIDFLLQAKSNWEVVDSFKGLSLAVERNHPLTQAQRVSFLEMWGILVGGVCSEAVTNAAKLFRKKYPRPRPSLGCNPGNLTN